MQNISPKINTSLNQPLNKSYVLDPNASSNSVVPNPNPLVNRLPPQNVPEIYKEPVPMNNQINPTKINPQTNPQYSTYPNSYNQNSSERTNVPQNIAIPQPSNPQIQNYSQQENIQNRIAENVVKPLNNLIQMVSNSVQDIHKEINSINTQKALVVNSPSRLK